MNKTEMTKNTKEQLIRTITAQVLKELSARGFTDGKNLSVPVTAADNTPGITQIPEKHSKEVMLEGVITARKLEGCTSVRLAENSIVTPAARDFIKEKKITLVVGESPINQMFKKECADSRWLYWSACPHLKNFELPGFPDVKIDINPLKNGMENLLHAIKALDQEISNGRVQGGILIVETSAKAAYCAHQHGSMRAVVGNFPKTIEEGIQQLAANVLILEYTHLGRTAITEMIKQFVTTKRPSAAECLSQLEESI